MFRGIASKVDDTKAQFREAPLLSLARFLVLLGLVTAVIVVIADIAMSWSRISTMSGQFTGAMAEAYTMSAAFVFCGICEVAGLVVAVVYYFQEKESALYREVKPTIVLALIALAVTLAGAPLLLGFVENILLIIGIIVVVVILFFFLSSAGSGSGESASAGGNASAAKEARGAKPEKAASSGPKPRVKYIDRRCKVFRAETTWSGKCIITWNGFADSVVCSQSDYDKGKMRILVSGTNEDHPVLPSPPAKWRKERGK